MIKAPISAILLHKNANELLNEAVESVQWCNEIIIIDDESILVPHDIAKRFHARLFSRTLISFADQRNFALQQATQPWVLFLDADEMISDALHAEILYAITQRHDAFLLPRQDSFMGKVLQYGETSEVTFLRLAKKDVGQWSRVVHERWDVQGSIGMLHAPILHTPHASLTTFIDKINRYTDLEVIERKKIHKKFSWFELLIYPKAKFMYNYFFRLGFLDGFPGFCMAYMMSIHSFIIRIKMHE